MQGLNERKTGISRSAIESWIARVPENLAATFLRDGSISNWLLEVSMFNTYRFAMVVLLTVVAACLIALRSRELWRSSAALVIAGLTLSAIPSILSVPITRYFVWFQILVYAGGRLLSHSTSSISPIATCSPCAHDSPYVRWSGCT